jgi:hypothetical protein
MPQRRRISKAKRLRITPDALEAYRQGDWPLLHRHLGLKPWEASPLDVRPTDAERTGAGVYEQSIPTALQLRAELEAQELP